jgi:sRNA-binding carbon storage regulator CsrA
MLVFTRRRGQKVIITTPQGDKIILHTLGTRAHDMRIGFEVSNEFQIDRFEVHEERTKNLYKNKQSKIDENNK